MYGQKYKPNTDYENSAYNTGMDQQYDSRTLPGQGRDRRYQHIQEPLHTGTSLSSLEPSSHIESLVYKHQKIHYSGEDLSCNTGAASNWPPKIRPNTKAKSTSMTNVLQDQAYDYRPPANMRNRSLDRSVARKRSDGQINYRNISVERDMPGKPYEPKETEYQTFYHSVQDRDQGIVKNVFSSSHSVFDSNLDHDTLILDLQTQVAELNKECANLQQELDTVKEKLSSSMNSIKNFWSPELKKERAFRREETAKIVQINDQLKVAQQEKQVKRWLHIILRPF